MGNGGKGADTDPSAGYTLKRDVGPVSPRVFAFQRAALAHLRRTRRPQDRAWPGQQTDHKSKTGKFQEGIDLINTNAEASKTREDLDALFQSHVNICEK